MDANLDITVILRRLRMHGFALDFLMNKKLIRAFTELTENKPIRYIKIIKPENRWDQLEAMGKMEKLRFYFYKKSLAITMKEEVKKIENTPDD